MRKILLLALFILMGSVTYAQKAEIFTDKVDKDGYRTTITKYISCAKGLIDPCPISVALFRFSKDDQTSWSLHTIWRCPNSFSIPQGVLRSMIVRTSFAVGQNEGKAVLNGAFFSFGKDGMKVVACDGNRLAVRERECEIKGIDDSGERTDVSFVLPFKTLGELLKLLKDDEKEISVTVRKTPVD